MSSDNVIIETERLVLKEINLANLEEMFELYSDPEVLKYTGESAIGTVTEMAEAIQERIENYRKYGYGRWATFLKEDMQFIGWAGLAYLPEFDEIDLGYRFFPKFWGKGFATEASIAILDHGFNQLKLDRIIAIALEENQASLRVMEKVGMQFEKRAPYEEGSVDAIWYKLEKPTS